MKTYALDSSALLRYLDGEAGAERVAELIQGHLDQVHHVIVSAVHWGEISSCVYRSHGERMLTRVLSRLRAFDFEVVAVTAERAERAALIKADEKIPYVDAFGVELVEQADHVFVTADFDLKPAAARVAIEFLARKAV